VFHAGITFGQFPGCRPLRTLRALRLKDRDDPITRLVAEKIIAVGRLGIEDPTEISKLALKELGSHRARRLAGC
jgi:hypothetical protein